MSWPRSLPAPRSRRQSRRPVRASIATVRSLGELATRVSPTPCGRERPPMSGMRGPRQTRRPVRASSLTRRPTSRGLVVPLGQEQRLRDDHRPGRPQPDQPCTRLVRADDGPCRRRRRRGDGPCRRQRRRGDGPCRRQRSARDRSRRRPALVPVPESERAQRRAIPEALPPTTTTSPAIATSRQSPSSFTDHSSSRPPRLKRRTSLRAPPRTVASRSRPGSVSMPARTSNPAAVPLLACRIRSRP